MMKKYMFGPGRTAVIFYLIKFELQILDHTWDTAFGYSGWNVFQMVLLIYENKVSEALFL